jgi:flagella basal body P-ring formation protein FlgA
MTVLSPARGVEPPVGAPPAESPLIVAARVTLLDRLQHERPDVRRFELTVMGRPTVPLSAQAGTAVAIHGQELSARVCVWMSLNRGGHSAGSVPVWFSVKAFRPVLVSQRSRAAHAKVGADDFTVDDRDVAMLSGIPLDVQADLAQLRVRHAIPSGHIVVRTDLEPIPPVLRGQAVNVEVRYGSVDIETVAVALREARFGESVTLQNPDSRMFYAARVVGQGRALVEGQ